MDNKTEISLAVNGSTQLEYYTTVVPRVGEVMDVVHEDYTGILEVMTVTHRVFQTKKGEIVNYVELDTKPVSEE